MSGIKVMSVSKVILKYTYTHTCQVVKWPDKVTEDITIKLLQEVCAIKVITWQAVKGLLTDVLKQCE